MVRDDELPGGTKYRALAPWIANHHATTFIYAGPAYGMAQVALALACRDSGRKAVLFTAKRKKLHERTQAAADAGAEIHEVPYGYLTVVRSRAKDYFWANREVSCLVPFGLESAEIITSLALQARRVAPAPAEVWCAAGSGVLARSLKLAWPSASVNAVLVGKKDAKVGAAARWLAPEKFEDDAEDPPPFPSHPNYDAKVWRFVKQHAVPGALFWNVAR